MTGRWSGRAAIGRATAGLALAAVALTLTLTLTAPASSAVRQPAVTRTAVAPYLEVTGANPDNLDAGIDIGLSEVTAAFVIGKGCKPTWDDGSLVAKNRAVARAIGNAQSRGTQVIVSFGGAGGLELARSCKNLSKLVDAYQSVISRFAVTSVDFDVEGAAIDPVKEKASIARRFTAIRQLQQSNPSLTVSVTVGVGRSGLLNEQLSFLEVAKDSGTTIDLVNIMTMDYGGPVKDMGAAAIASAEGTLPQLQSLWPSFTYANLGVTPMIGKNDSPKETTTVADADAIAAFAGANGVGRLAFWSLNRDQQCSATGARGDCSGVKQDPLDFTRAFLALGGA
jgi:chitinase